MAICVCGPSALELYRNRGRMAPELLECARTSRLDGCVIPAGLALKDATRQLGLSRRPYHLMVSAQHRARSMDDVIRHVRKQPLPPRSLLCLEGSALVASPELTFYELALTYKRDRRLPMDEVDLALVGFELCGTYLLDEDEAAWTGFINTGAALTSAEKIARVLARLEGARSVRKAARALALVLDGSNSPMETILALMLTLPRRLGGMGFRGASMNYGVDTPAGPKWVDIAFPQQRVGVEYKGRDPHSVERTGRDDRRQNKLHGSGWTVINVWYEDVVVAALYQELVRDIASALGVRLRIRDKGFEARRRILLSRLVPAFKRYGSVA